MNQLCRQHLSGAQGARTRQPAIAACSGSVSGISGTIARSSRVPAAYTARRRRQQLVVLAAARPLDSADLRGSVDSDSDSEPFDLSGSRSDDSMSNHLTLKPSRTADKVGEPGAC